MSSSCECDTCDAKHGHEEHNHDKLSQRIEIIKIVVGLLLFISAISSILPPNIETGLLFIAYLVLGFEVLKDAVMSIVRGKWMNENFLMSIASIGAFAIGEIHEAVAVMLFYCIGSLLESYAVNRSRREINAVLKIRADYANVLRGEKIERVNPEVLEVGDIILVRPAEKIPVDGVVTEGESDINTSALTGESLPRGVRIGDEVLSGCINGQGLIKVRVTKLFGESTASIIINMVEHAAENKSPQESFIAKFTKIYTPIVIAVAAAVAFIPPIFLGDLLIWIKKGLIFLVISCPCALVVSIPLGFFGGIGRASKEGVLIKGGNYLDALKNVDALVFDKTGTLTTGEFAVRKVILANAASEEDVLRYAAYAEAHSSHPIAQAIQERADAGEATEKLMNYTEIAGHGVSVHYGEKRILVGNDKLMAANDIEVNECDEFGTKVYVAVEHEYLGCIIIADEVKKGATELVGELEKIGISNIVMLTGDSAQQADFVSAVLGINKVYAELLPQDKLDKLEQIMRDSKGNTAFVGDGINDAPVLARADVGIAMGGIGRDAAVEAADIVVMTDEPLKIVKAIKIARYTHLLVMQNIILALGIKAAIMLLSIAGYANMGGAVVADVGVLLLAVFNSLRVLRYK
jgi:Cd2+/Zn2+-exporting ATPase